MIGALLLFLACAPGVGEEATCSEVRECADLQGEETYANDRNYRVCAACDEATDACEVTWTRRAGS